MSYDNVVKTTVYLTNMDFFGTVNTVYGKYFASTLPARSCVAVAALPKGALVEVEVTAYAE
ncbi:MAG: Rid family hydrolase, partial [Anaeroglobus sp.]